MTTPLSVAERADQAARGNENALSLPYKHSLQ